MSTLHCTMVLSADIRWQTAISEGGMCPCCVIQHLLAPLSPLKIPAGSGPPSDTILAAFTKHKHRTSLPLISSRAVASWCLGYFPKHERTSLQRWGREVGLSVTLTWSRRCCPRFGNSWNRDLSLCPHSFLCPSAQVCSGEIASAHIPQAQWGLTLLSCRGGQCGSADHHLVKCTHFLSCCKLYEKIIQLLLYT